MNKYSAIVTGLTGQDGSYLAEKLIDKGCKVYGVIRRSSRGLDLGNANHLANNSLLEVVEGDILDQPFLTRLCINTRPSLFFNMAAQSHVHTSFEQPVYTAQATGVGVLNCLEAIRLSGIHSRFLQASTSELYGGISENKNSEQTSFYPKSPYATAKLFAYWSVVNYRESYKFFAVNSICHNHESSRRGPNFVTRKITQSVARIKHGLQDKLFLGNLDARRDWSFAGDIADGMILMLTKSTKPVDYVLGSGKTHSVREFCNVAFSHVGLDYKRYVKIDPRFYRPNEVDVLVSDPSKIKNDLNWQPQVSFEQLVKMMVDHDLKNSVSG